MNRKGIFVIDPGETTGVAWAVVDTEADTVKSAMRDRQLSASASVNFGKFEGGDIVKIVQKQVEALSALHLSFLGQCLLSKIPVQVVCEHFVLTQSSHHRPGIQGIVPAYLLGAIFNSPISNSPIVLQTAATGMKWHQRHYHDLYSTWIVGREHEREAFAHLAARLHKILR